MYQNYQITQAKVSSNIPMLNQNFAERPLIETRVI